MRKAEFLALLALVIEAEPGSLKGEERLDSLEGWDSLAVVGFLALVDEKLGITPTPKDIAAANTVNDLVALFGDIIA